MVCFSTLSIANIHLFKVNNKNTWERCEVSSKLTIKTPEQSQWRGIVWTYFTHFSSISIVEFEQVNINWVNAT